MTENCEICGRTQEELNEFEEDYTIEKGEEDSVRKCGKCRSEYNKGMGNDEESKSAEDYQPQSSNKSWLDQVTA